ncbi:hypothetical protein SAMN05421676_105120 [Salinibacillus kushneri]|uniref:DUF2357 domain-containing protein n=1 Tax=Salinibacillus kushneri TaxID=237682 RepID=A0A1I0EYN5_9BACI|nr:restriction endonuclease-like protein [Salinibacillus kushneri]SET50267.1 hypothetical protein SAMN05421676_105120 [Salinibacillus kushneri]
MGSLPSGLANHDVELLHIETENMTLVIKGKPYHEKFEGLAQYRKLDFSNPMQLKVDGEGVESVRVFDINEAKLREKYSHRPIFFENGVYTLVVSPKGNKELTFYHEHKGLRNAIDRTQLGNSYALMGSLQFLNEVGLSTFEIREEDETLLSVTIEIFPTKLDYEKDYKMLLEEVNDEIYNLAYHFIKKTYLGARTKLDGSPSPSEFFRLMQYHFDQLFKAINRIEQQPHQKLITTHTKVRGDQLGQQDHKSRQYLKKRPHLFAKVDKGIPINNQHYMPISGLNRKKEVTYDTNENRYIKWMMYRLIEKLNDLIQKLTHSRFDVNDDYDVMNHIKEMKRKLKGKRNNPFWRSIGPLDRSVMSLVLQMAPGYREAFQIYLLVSKGLALQGNIYQMSVKDVATLYEYWTYLKLGQILGRKYKVVSENIIKVNQDGLFVNLQPNSTAKRVFRHPHTSEKITLIYQKREKRLPTITQIPDTMLSIEKKGKNYEYQYVFDAKYRVDFALSNTTYARNYDGLPGPMEDDINVMHRYRDSIVIKNDGPFERKAFGAYVLFPWDNEDSYQDHKLYKSIDEVNIGGLPFLPNATTLVEQFVERLIDKSPEEIQQEGILPRGTIGEWNSSIEDKVMVLKVSSEADYQKFLQNGKIQIAADRLHTGWQDAKYISLYTTKETVENNGVTHYGEIEEVQVGEREVMLNVKGWMRLFPAIQPVGYGIANYIMTDVTNLLEAKELPELFMKSTDEKTIWRMLRRLSDRVKNKLDDKKLDMAQKVESFVIKDMKVSIRGDVILVENSDEKEFINLKSLRKQPSKVFKQIVRMF